MSVSRPPRTLPVALIAIGVSISLAGVLAASLMAGWFSWWRNALSDLGHATRHPETAVLFNGSLIVGGILVAAGGSLLLCAGERALALGFMLVGLGLALVGGFDEVYGRVHFAVSVFLFASLGVLLVAVAVSSRSPYPLTSIAVGAAAWALHFVAGVPEGAAVPEIVSVVATLPWALRSLLRVAGRG